MPNPLLRDRDVDFLLHDVLHVGDLSALPHFADHGRETIDPFLASVRRLAREVLYPAYKPMDEAPPLFEGGRVTVHPRMKQLYPQLVSLGMASASRPLAVGGQQLPFTVSTIASAYLMAANLGAYGYVGLTAGAAHLLEAYGSDELRRLYMDPLYEGRFTGTMALTEPHAGSSLADVRTRATPVEGGHFLMKGDKIFISGGDHDLTENIVHMTLARIDGAPPGIKGVSLFAVPKLRLEGGRLVPNDVSVTGVIHKIGWRGLPSVALGLGDRGDCRGWLVGEPHRGISYMFQMMNEARIMVGVNGVATASVAFHEALAYANDRPQGRPLAAKDPSAPQVPIVAHADVRRMLLRQKAIVEGGLCLVGRAAMFADLAGHAVDEAERERARLLLDLLTPVAKSFPAERGFESNALALQIHGGYGYSSEYLPEAWLRDQKLNSIHEGTTGIQGMDLLGRKVVAGGGAALVALGEEIEKTVAQATKAGVPEDLARDLLSAFADVRTLTAELAARGMAGDVEGMMLHSADFLELFSTVVVAWQWLAMSAAAHAKAGGDAHEKQFLEGKKRAAEYFLRTELPKARTLIGICRSGEDSYARISPAEL